MNRSDNRREFLQKLGVFTLAAGSGRMIPSLHSDKIDPVGGEPLFAMPEIRSLPPSELFTVLDLSGRQLQPVRRALEEQGYGAALSALLHHYRSRFPKPEDVGRPSGTESERQAIERADNMERNIFQRGPYPPADYGEEIDWGADPAGDIEWVAQINRFYWTRDLIAAWRATGEERYVRTLVRLATDWFEKHTLEETVDKIHPVYDYWKGYVWLDIETGRRAHSICHMVRELIHSEAFSAEFLGRVLASLYDHQIKTEKIPMGHVHNKSIFEQRGVVEILYTFPEFADRERWLDLAVDRTRQMLIAQTTVDGVQREYSGGYHNGVYRDAVAIESQLKTFGRELPGSFRKRTREMAEYTFGISTPDLGYPMIGDTGRPKTESDDRSRWSLYRHLVDMSEEWNDPKFRALAELDESKLPSNGSCAFPHAGLYAMRNGWNPDQVYMNLHCSPPAISSHDQPDNGTFELWAYGRWLMPDSGYYTYGLDPEAREWHRQTRVHSTLTADGRNTSVKGRHLLWESDNDSDLLCVENQAYQYLAHRRTVWFADKRGELPFFLLLDEAIGTAPSPEAPDPVIEGVGGFDPLFRGNVEAELEIHFPLAPGDVEIDRRNNRARTVHPDTNLLLQVVGSRPVQIRREEGWHAWGYLQRERRPSITASWRAEGPEERGPFTFVSLLVPYRGGRTPSCRFLTDPADLTAGETRFEIEVEVAGRRHRLVRDLA